MLGIPSLATSRPLAPGVAQCNEGDATQSTQHPTQRPTLRPIQHPTPPDAAQHNPTQGDPPHPSYPPNTNSTQIQPNSTQSNSLGPSRRSRTRTTTTASGLPSSTTTSCAGRSAARRSSWRAPGSARSRRRRSSDRVADVCASRVVVAMAVLCVIHC